jgi:hypothetical protein
MRHILLAIFAMLTSPALADGWARVTDRASFVDLVRGKSLTSLGVSLTVAASGTLGGRAFGQDVSGQWTWNDGYFCRTMQAGSRVFARNCQLVERLGSRVRFIADQGPGDTADLQIN